MKIPDEVKDKKAYVQYRMLAKHPILNDKKTYICSDGTEINLASFHHVVRKNVSHLKISEQKIVLDLKDEYCNINNNATKWKRQAFGAKKPGEGKENSLIRVKHDEIIELFGKFHTPEEVVKIANMEWGLPIGLTHLKKYKDKYNKEIEELKEKYRASYSDVRLGVKRSRLEELTYLYNSQKDKYNDKPSNENYRLLLVTLEAIRKEAEGDRLTIDGKVDVNYEVNIQNHMRDEVFRTMNLKEIILGRVAARMGVNPVKLIHSLNNSYYKQFSNVLGDFDPDNEGEVIYPSQLSYDFERIGKAQSVLDKLAEDAVIIDEEQAYKGKSEERAMTVKELLQQKLKEKQQNINKNK